jgi:hypothetical protein
MDKVLFCPFCGEAFEERTHCPEHELALLPWADLPRPERELPEHEALPWYSPRMGRLGVAASAVLMLFAFVALPVGRVDGAVHMGGSMLRLALRGTPRLWLVPAAAAAVLMILYRRRSPLAMRSARLAVGLVGSVPLPAALSTWFAARRAVALLAERTREDLVLQVGAGLYVIGIATLALLAVCARLGVGPRLAARAAHGRIDSGR